MNLKDIVKIAAGEDHAVAVSKTGEVYAWGYNDAYQLGNGTTTRSATTYAAIYPIPRWRSATLMQLPH